MFGKNKKNKKNIKSEGSSSQPVIHTMQDDLNINLESGASDNVPEINTAPKTSSPFSGGAPREKKQEMSGDKLAVQAEEKTSPKPEMNSAFSSGQKETPFTKSNSADSLSASASMDSKINTAPKPEVKTNPEMAPKTETAPTMPKSVNDLTTNVDKEESAIKESKPVLAGAENISEIMPDNLSEKEKKDDKTENKGKSGIFIYATIVILIIAIGVAGYFVWDSNYIDINKIVSNKDNIQSDTPVEEPEIIIEEDDNNSEVNDNSEDTDVFSEKVNFLTISSLELNKDGLVNILNQKFLEMSSFQGNILEFIAVDETNNPIKFSEFSKAFEIDLSAGVSGQLSEDFSIYLYKNGAIEKMSIAIKTINSELLKVNLKKDEANLISGMQSLILEDILEEDLIGKTFKDSIYENIEIRFTNLNDSSSIDYAIVGDYLLFATSKDSGRSIMNRLLLEDESSVSEEEISTNDLVDTTDMINAVEAVEGAETSKTKDIFQETPVDNEMEDGETLIETE